MAVHHQMTLEYSVTTLIWSLYILIVKFIEAMGFIAVHDSCK